MTDLRVDTHAHAMASFGTPTSFGELFRSIGTRYRAFRSLSAEQVRIRRELESYTDRQLSDLGFSRLDIPSVAAGHFVR